MGNCTFQSHMLQLMNVFIYPRLQECRALSFTFVFVQKKNRKRKLAWLWCYNHLFLWSKFSYMLKPLKEILTIRKDVCVSVGVKRKQYYNVVVFTVLYKCYVFIFIVVVVFKENINKTLMMSLILEWYCNFYSKSWEKIDKIIK